MTRQIQWLAINAFVAFLIWSASSGSDAALNLVSFLGGLSLLLTILVSSSDAIKDDLRKKGRSVPAWLNHGVGFLFVGAMVWHGWYATGIAFLLLDLIEIGIYSKSEKEETQ